MGRALLPRLHVEVSTTDISRMVLRHGLAPSRSRQKVTIQIVTFSSIWMLSRGSVTRDRPQSPLPGVPLTRR